MFGLNFIKKLKPAKFQYEPEHLRKEGDLVHLGFIAQDIAEILDHKDYALLRKDEQGFYRVDHGELIAPLVKAIQELSDKVDELSKQKDGK